MQESQHRVDEALRRLDAALEHRNFLRQRLSEFELQGLADCWRAARRCVPLINAPRAINSGTDPEVLKHHTTALADGQNELLEAMNRHEPFLGEAIVELLDGIRQGCYGELLQIQHTEHFERDWWTRGAANQETVRKLTDQLKEAVRRRVAELRQLAD
jgi:hypothetical protein